jgi:hypothetical protein
MHTFATFVAKFREGLARDPSASGSNS